MSVLAILTAVAVGAYLTLMQEKNIAAPIQMPEEIIQLNHKADGEAEI